MSLSRHPLFLLMPLGLAAVGCAAAGSQAQSPAMRAQVEGEFNRCMEQQRYGDARGCWQMFLDRYGQVASAAELAYSKEHLSGNRPGTAGVNSRGYRPNPETEPTPQALSQGLIRIQEKPISTLPNASAANLSFPNQQASFDTCYQNFRMTGDAQADLTELGNRCGNPCGMLPLSMVVSGQQDESDNVDVFGMDLRADRCYRFFAVGERGIEDLDSAIADQTGNILMRDVFTDAAPILGPREPFCPAQAGRYKFIISVAKGHGTFKFQVWQGQKH